MRLWVVDASPLIFLAKLDRLDLLKGGADQVVVPPAVLREIGEHPDDASRKIDDARRSWLGVRAVENRRIVDVLMADLDAGESEVIALALEAKAERVILDDLDARRFAHRIGIERVGTLGLLLAAKLRGELPNLSVEIDRLRQAGFRVSPPLSQALLLEAGEAGS
jgi:predicted nucleic acid-binding protein